MSPHTFPRRALLATFLAFALLPAPVAAEEPATAHREGGSDACSNVAPDASLGCGVFARTDWTLLGCDASTCTVRMDSDANGWSELPGWIHMETTAVVDDAGCDGVAVLSFEVQDASCVRVCQTDKVSWTSSCAGEKTAVLTVVPGACSSFWAVHRFSNEATGSRAVVVFFTDVCRDKDGRAFFLV